MATLLNQGAYGCIYYPGFTCKGNISKEKKYVKKLEIKDQNSVNEKEIRKDPTYKCRTTLANNTRRTTRATNDPATPHCSLITSIVNNFPL